MKKYDIAAYIWPAYTGDELRTRIFWPEGMGEWETVRDAKPKFEGHQWPRKPLWGYVNEADPAVMEMEINEAVRHGVNVFIYDWYWYDRRPFLENCLNDGFLKAKNNKDMKFYLMWANHSANHLWNRHLSDSEARSTIIWDASVTRADFEAMAERLVDKYFHYDNYYRIDDKPVFMIYDLSFLIKGFGGIEQTKEALDWFRELVKSKGFPGVHLQFCVRNYYPSDGVNTSRINNFPELLDALQADSYSHYQYGMMAEAKGDYLNILDKVQEQWKINDKLFHQPYCPHVSCGWDNNPRYTEFRPRIITNNTPENFEKALRAAKEYIDTHELPAPLITINSWNEWTESSYLEPDDLYGYGYLDAIKKVFLDKE